METINLNNLVIISFISFFFLGCSSTQLIDVSKSDQLDELLNDIGSVEMKINAKEEVKQLIIKSIVSFDADIRINFVEQVDTETLVIKNNFLNQEFAYFCKSANDYLEEITKQYLFDFQKNDEVFVFYGDKFRSSANLIKKNYPGVRVIKLDGSYDELVLSLIHI